MVVIGNEKERGKAENGRGEIGTVAGGGVIQGVEVGVGIARDMAAAAVQKGVEMVRKSQRRKRKRRKRRMMAPTTQIQRLQKLISSEQPWV